MARRINHVSDLPDWYSLDKYRAASQLDALGWYWQLAARLELNKLVMFADRFDQLHGNTDVMELFTISKKLLEEVRTRPILDAEAPQIVNDFIGKNLMPPNGCGVRLATLNDLSNLMPELQSYEQRIEYAFCGDVLTCISMDVPDKVLIENFATFIRKTKEARGAYDSELSLSNFRKPDFKEWVRLGILPYIDLKIWEDLEEVKIPNRVMADAIFPHGEGGEEVVRKTTGKIVEQILNKDILNALAAISSRWESSKLTVSERCYKFG